MSLGSWIKDRFRAGGPPPLPPADGANNERPQDCTRDFAIQLPPGQALRELVEFILDAQKVYREHHEYAVRSVRDKFRLTETDARLAVDRVNAGALQAHTRPYIEPDRVKDPIAWTAYHRFHGSIRKNLKRFRNLYIPWRLVRWVAVSLAFSFLATAVKLWIDRIQADQAVQDEIAQLDATDLGWTFEDIEARRKKLAPEENRALLVIEIANEIPKDWPIWNQTQRKTRPLWQEPDDEEEQKIRERQFIVEEIDTLGPRESLSPLARSLLDAELLRVPQALAKAQDLVTYPEGSFPITYEVVWLRTIVGDVQKAREVDHLLQIQSLQLAQDSDGEAACQAAMRIVYVGRSFGDHNMTIPHLVRIAVMSSAVATTERALALGQAEPATLRQLQELFEKEDVEEAFLVLQAARLDRALMHRMLQSLWEGKITLKDLDFWRFESEAWWDRFALYFGLSPLRKQHATFLRESREEFEKWKQPWDAIEAPRRRGIAIHGETFVAGMERYKRVQPRIQALMRSAALAMASERFRLDKGLWPKTLEELTPAYVKEIPQDPYGKGPMRVVRKEDSIVFYSVWKDGKDDGGILDRRLLQQEGTDYGFQLWDPSQRKLQKRLNR